MASSPAYSILFSATLSGTVSAGSAGDVLIKESADGLFTLATLASRGTRRSTGIALSSYVANGVVDIQQEGEVAASLAGLGTGTAAYVRVSDAGALERVASPGASDDVVGWVETDGTLHLRCGQIPGGYGTGGGGGGGATLPIDLADPGTSITGTLGVANGGTGATASTGSGNVVLATSPTISAPTLSSTPVLSGASASTSNNAKGTEVNVNPVNVQTTDATVTTLDSFTIASNSVVVVSWLVAAVNSTLASGAGYAVSAVFRNNGGAAGQVGTTTTTVIGEDVAGWTATADNSTTTIRLRVTGAAATTVQWTSVLTCLTVIP